MDLRGLSYVDPAYVDPVDPAYPLRGLSYVGPAYVDPRRGAFYVDSPTWTLVVWTLARGAPCVDSPTLCLVM